MVATSIVAVDLQLVFGEEFGEKRGVFDGHSINYLASECQVRALDVHGDKDILYDEFDVKVVDGESLVKA